MLSLAVIFPPNVGAATYAVPYPTVGGQVLPEGTIVRVVDSSGAVRPARQDEGQRILGCVASLPAGTLPTGKVGVASAGVVLALVSDAGGEVKTGDRIAISPLEGVGMKTTGPGWIIGTAQAPLSSMDQEGVSRQDIKDNHGTVKTVVIKKIPVLIGGSYYSPGSDGKSATLVDSLQSAITALVGRPVSAERALVALLVFGISIILLVAMVYSAVRNSLVAIGRNPMAHAKIIKILATVLMTAAVVVAITLAVVYLILLL